MSRQAGLYGGVLLYLTTEVDPEIEADFGRWSEAHARDNLGVPGVLSARRLRRHDAYRGVGDGPTFLTHYALRDLDVLESEAYRNRDSRMPAAFAGRFQFARSLYRSLDAPDRDDGATPRGASILHVTVDVEAAHRDEFLAWYVGVHVPAVLSAPGILGARRYVRIEEAGSQIHYLTLYEMEDPGVVSRPETLRASEAGACPARLAPHRRATNQVYDEIFAATART